MQRNIFIGIVVTNLVLLSTFFQVSGRPVYLDLQQQGAGKQSTLTRDEVNNLIGVLRDKKLRETQPDPV